MRCRKTRKMLTAYLSEELGPEEMSRVREHLADCSSCTQELTYLKKFGEITHRLREIEPSTGFEARFWRRVEETKRSKPLREHLPHLGWTLRWRWGLSTAAGLLLLIGFYTVWERFPMMNQKQTGAGEISEIVKDIDFYQNYEILEELDLLIKIAESEKKQEGENGKASGDASL